MKSRGGKQLNAGLQLHGQKRVVNISRYSMGVVSNASTGQKGAHDSEIEIEREREEGWEREKGERERER